MEFITIGVLVLTGLYVKGKIPHWQAAHRVRAIRAAYKQNLRLINRLPMNGAEREAARDAARQRLLRELDGNML